jgi:DNA-directed RNA polymerase specialized sigma24 family protein
VVGWLLVVTRRLATDRFRRRLTPFVAPRVRDLNEDGVAAWLDVRAAFGRLSAKERAALISVGVLGFTPDEASEPLGMSPGAVRAAVSRAREKLESER